MAITGNIDPISTIEEDRPTSVGSQSNANVSVVLSEAENLDFTGVSAVQRAFTSFDATGFAGVRMTTGPVFRFHDKLR